MTFTHPYQISFELELLLGDLGLKKFRLHRQDPMDIASRAYCQHVAESLSEHAGRPWEAADDLNGPTAYRVTPAPSLGPNGWPEGAVASITLSTPPLAIDLAQHVRLEIADWVRSMSESFNEEISDFSCDCSWLISIHADPAADFSVPGLVAGVDELELLTTMERHSSGKAAPQRHSYGPLLLRQLADSRAMKIIASDMPSFLIDNSSRDWRTAVDLERLSDSIVGLRHFASWAFFHDESIPSLIGDFITAAALKGRQAEAVAQRTLEKFMLLNKWFGTIERLFHLRFGEAVSPVPPSTEIIYAGAPAGIMLWAGTARLILKTDSNVQNPTIFRQNLADWKEALAVLALDIAEIRAAGIDPLPIENEKLSFEIDRLAQTLRNHGLLGTGSTAEHASHSLH